MSFTGVTGNVYETIIIFKPTLSDEEIEKAVNKIKEIISKEKGEVITVENWGKRKLAYDVKKQKKGNYILLRYKGKGTIVTELERNCRLDDAVIRFLTVRLKGKQSKRAQEAIGEMPSAVPAGSKEEASNS